MYILKTQTKKYLHFSRFRGCIIRTLKAIKNYKNPKKTKFVFEKIMVFSREIFSIPE